MTSIVNALSKSVYQNNWIGSHQAAQLEWVLLTSGDTAFHDNVILFGLFSDHPHPSLVAKACRLPENAWMLKNEYDRMGIVWEACKNASSVRLPEPIAFEIIDRQPLLIMSYSPGDNIPSLRNKRFWRSENQIKSLLILAAGAIREIHDLTTQKLHAGEIVESDFQTKAEIFLSIFPWNRDETRIIEGLIEKIRIRSTQAGSKRMVQGDFCHGNLLRSKDNQHLSIVDWQFARWATDSSFDVYLFILAAALSATKGVNEKSRAEQAKTVLNKWMLDLFPVYLNAYQTGTPVDILPIREGFLMSCIEKAARSIKDFGHSHREDPLWCELFRTLVDFPEI